MKRQNKFIVVAASLAILAGAAAAGPLFRRGVVTTEHNGSDVSVRFQGDAAADLYEHLAQTNAAERWSTEDGRIVDVIIGSNVTCAHQLRQRLGIARNAKEAWACQVEIAQYGVAAAASAPQIVKIIGVEN